MMRLPLERAIARTVYEEVRSRQSCGFDLWQMAKHSIELAPALTSLGLLA